MLRIHYIIIINYFIHTCKHTATQAAGLLALLSSLVIKLYVIMFITLFCSMPMPAHISIGKYRISFTSTLKLSAKESTNGTKLRLFNPKINQMSRYQLWAPLCDGNR